jgi:hypothetical protein
MGWNIEIEKNTLVFPNETDAEAVVQWGDNNDFMWSVFDEYDEDVE